MKKLYPPSIARYFSRLGFVDSPNVQEYLRLEAKKHKVYWVNQRLNSSEEISPDLVFFVYKSIAYIDKLQ